MEYMCNPQNDFDCYCNNSWRKRIIKKTYVGNSVPSIISNPIDTFKHEQEKINKQIDQIIIQLSKDEKIPQFNILYKSYINRTTSYSFIKSIVHTIISVNSINSLIDCIINLNMICDDGILFGVDIGKDPIKGDKYINIVSDPDLSLGYIEIYLDEKSIRDENNKKRFNEFNFVLVSIYEWMIHNKIIMECSIDDFCSDVICMEFMIAQNLQSLEKSMDINSTTNISSIKSFIRTFDTNLLWHKFLKNTHPDSRIQYTNPKYLFFLKSLLILADLDKKFMTKIKNYLIYLFFMEYGKYTDCASKLAKIDHIEFSQKKIDRSIFISLCGSQIEKIYEASNSDKNTNNHVREIILNMINLLQDTWKNTDLFCNKTKESALKKISDIKIFVGPTTNNNESITSYNESVINISSDDFFQNMASIRLNQKKRAESYIGKDANVPCLDILSDLFSFKINAYCIQEMNAIYIPTALISSKIFFDKNQSLEYNYGGLGCVVGHELMHLFDIRGSLYDYRGNISKWWDDLDYKTFQIESNKIKKHYSTIIINDMKLNPNNTISEDIADICGIKISLRALMKNPDINSSKIETFFTRWGHIWRYIHSERYVENTINTNEHSPNIVRINAPFSHIDIFYKIYNLKYGDMNYLKPEDRCKLMD